MQNFLQKSGIASKVILDAAVGLVHRFVIVKYLYMKWRLL